MTCVYSVRPRAAALAWASTRHAARAAAPAGRARVQLHLQQLRRAADAAQRVLDLVRQVAHQFLVGLRQAERALLAVLARLLLDLDDLQQHPVRGVHLADADAHQQRLGRAQRRALQLRLEAAAGDLVALQRQQRLAHRQRVDEPVEHVAAQQRAARHGHRVLERGVGQQAMAVAARDGDHRRQLVEGVVLRRRDVGVHRPHLRAAAAGGRPADQGGSLASSRLIAAMSLSLRAMPLFSSATRSRYFW